MEKVGVFSGIKSVGQDIRLDKRTLLPLRPLGGSKNGVLDVEGVLTPWLVFSLRR